MKLLSDHVQHTNEYADLPVYNTGYDFTQYSVNIVFIKDIVKVKVNFGITKWFGFQGTSKILIPPSLPWAGRDTSH